METARVRSPAVEEQRCRRVCIMCDPEDGAWVVGAYTLILGIIGLLLLIAVQVWDNFKVSGPIGIILCLTLFLAGFLLFYGLYRRQVWWIYTWFVIFAVNFVSHVTVWSLTVMKLVQFYKISAGNPYISATDSDNSRQALRFLMAGITIGAMCLFLSLWSLVVIVAVRRRMHANRGYIMTRPFSFAVRTPRGSDVGHHGRQLSFVNFRKSSTCTTPTETPQI